jgi:hypothetical protein
MQVLFIHQNFPGQFRHIAAHLAKQPGVQVLAIGREQAPGLPGVRLCLDQKVEVVFISNKRKKTISRASNTWVRRCIRSHPSIPCHMCLVTSRARARYR